MPLVVKRVTELLGKEPHCRLNPDEVVALGAAVQAGLVGRAAAVEDLVVTDVAPFTLGIEISKDLGAEIRDGLLRPGHRPQHDDPGQPGGAVRDDVRRTRRSIKVRVYQGESRGGPTENLLLGEFEVRGIPPGPAGQAVDIRFTYDLNGVLEVEATVVATEQDGHARDRQARAGD